MKLTLKRIFKGEEYTIGKLYINGVYECDTIEDKVRNLSVESKIPGKTAIPAGTYEIRLDIQSPKYSKRPAFKWCDGYLPRLMDVPYFEGILIHSGNTEEDSAGCIIVGENKVKGKVINSMVTLKKLYNKLNSTNERIEIEII